VFSDAGVRLIEAAPFSPCHDSQLTKEYSMPFVSTNFLNNPAALPGTWVCSRASSLGPSEDIPASTTRTTPNFCGQCVSFVTTVCPTIPVRTAQWKKGELVKKNANISQGTAIATFDSEGNYHGHAAIYVRQDAVGIHVMDQWVTGAGKAIGPRVIKWNGTGVSNNGDSFYVVEP
jgi:hypothetical protein